MSMGKWGRLLGLSKWASATIKYIARDLLPRNFKQLSLIDKATVIILMFNLWYVYFILNDTVY